MKPTLASLKRELSQARKDRDEALAIRDASIRFYDETKESQERIKGHLRPVLAYFGQQWIGDRVRKEYQGLVQFAKGNGDE